MSKSHKVTPAEMKAIKGETDGSVALDDDATARIEDGLELVRVRLGFVEDALAEVGRFVSFLGYALTALGLLGVIAVGCELWWRFR